MQKLTIGNTQYTLRNDRDLGKFLKSAKATPKTTRQKQSARYFPIFVPGETSTMDYVRSYWVNNGFDMDAYDKLYKGKLSPLPASTYDPSIPEVEIETLA